VIPKAESKSRRHHERKPVSLLLLEDDPRFAELLGARLRKMRLAELRLEVAGSLAAALGRLAAEPFDLVLSDLNLPDSSGLATLEALSRAGEQLIIVLTGDPNPALRASAMEAGAYDFVSKDDLGPATLERLVRLATIQANTYRTLRESEARFRGLTALSSDWYWEQDAELRFVATEGSSDARGGITPAAHIGKRRWELPATEIVKQTWDEHKAVLKARRPFRDLLLRRIGEGEARFVSVSGEPIFDLRGTFRGYRGVATDVTDRVLAEQELRESEGRFRRLTQLIADVYWEQDEQFRFTSFTDSSPRGPEGLGTRALIGKRRWELGYVNMTPADWARHIAILEAHQPFQNLELCRLAEGRKLWINTSAEPVFDAAGAFKGYRGVGQDITERKREEELLRLEHAVTRSLAQADTAASGVEAVIRAICETQSWECGRYFFVDEKADVLRFGEAWGVPGPAVERFLAKSRTLTYRRGEGLSGCVWQASEPLWVSDVSRDPRASGSSPAAMAGGSLQGGSFVFPVMSEGRTIGVLSFSSGDVCGPDQRLLQAVGVIGSQVGQFLQRKGSEEELRRFRLAMDNSADMIVLIERATMRFVDVNARGAAGEPRGAREGLRRADCRSFAAQRHEQPLPPQGRIAPAVRIEAQGAALRRQLVHRCDFARFDRIPARRSAPGGAPALPGEDRPPGAVGPGQARAGRPDRGSGAERARGAEGRRRGVRRAGSRRTPGGRTRAAWHRGQPIAPGGSIVRTAFAACTGARAWRASAARGRDRTALAVQLGARVAQRAAGSGARR